MKRGAWLGLALILLPSAVAVAGGDSGVRLTEMPEAHPGECYASVARAPRYETRSERVLKTPATQRIETVPARYDWVVEEKHIPGGKRRIVTQPAEVKWTEETVQVAPAGTRTVRSAPVYRTVEEKQPQAGGVVLKSNAASKTQGGALCVVDAPQQYSIVHKQVLVSPGKTQQVPVPARFKTVRKRTVITPAQTKLVDAPERVVKVRVRKLVDPERQYRVDVPAVYEDVQHQVLVSSGQIEWRAVLCDTNATPALVRRLQLALQAQGYYHGSPTGRIDAPTQDAVRDYLQAQGLPQVGMTMETLDRLGVAQASGTGGS